MTAADLMAQLAADPAYVQRESERVAREQHREGVLREDERELVDGLHWCGVTVDSVWDLIGAKDLPAEAVSLLLLHLARPHEPAIHEGIARVLGGVPAADRPRTTSALRDALVAERVVHVRDAICLSIGELAGPEDLDELVALLSDGSIGPSRVMLLSALTRFGDRGRAALDAAIADPVLGAEAAHQLRSMTRRSSRPAGRSVPGDVAAGELVSIGLDRNAVPRFIRGLAELLGLAGGTVGALIGDIEALDVEETLITRLVTADGVELGLEAFVDDVDAVDVVVRGPEQFRTSLEPWAAGFADDPG